MKAYTGFNKNMPSGGYQLEEGKEYVEDEEVLYEKGFRAYEYPLGVFICYPPNDSEYYEVELGEVSNERRDDTTVCVKKIKIGAKLTIAKLVDAAVNYTMERAHLEEGGQATGDQGAALAAGDRGAASATGYRGAASATGRQGTAVALGFGGKARATLDGFITVAEWRPDDDGLLQRVDVQSAKVDGKTIKADTWYILRDGKFEEV